MNVSEQQWRVPRRVVTLKVIVAIVFIGLAWWFIADPERLLVAALVALVIATYAIRDVIWPVRLSVGRDGVMVSRGFVGRREIAWGEIERVRMDRRRRLGSTSEMLEIDIDTTLFLFSKHELDAPLEDVLTALRGFQNDAR